MRVSRVIAAALGVFMVTSASAMAQTASAPTPAPPTAKTSAMLTGIQIGVFGGLASVQNIGGQFGANATYAVNDHILLEGEGVVMQDVVTRAKLNAVTGFANYLTTSQGKAATATIKAPASYAGIGLRFLIPTQSSVHPYVSAGGGIARVVQQPAFTLGGTDITANLSTYGVTLGADFTGEVTKAAFTGGVGAMIDRNRLTFDVGVRLLSIQTDGQKTNVLKAQFGIAYKF